MTHGLDPPHESAIIHLIRDWHIRPFDDKEADELYKTSEKGRGSISKNTMLRERIMPASEGDERIKDVAEARVAANAEKLLRETARNKNLPLSKKDRAAMDKAAEARGAEAGAEHRETRGQLEQEINTCARGSNYLRKKYSELYHVWQNEHLKRGTPGGDEADKEMDGVLNARFGLFARERELVSKYLKLTGRYPEGMSEDMLQQLEEDAKTAGHPDRKLDDVKKAKKIKEEMRNVA